MNKKMNSLFAAAAAGAIALSAFAMPAFAQVGVGVSGNANVTTGGVSVSANASLKAGIISKAKDRANQEITRRITALNALNTRVNAMTKLSADEKTSLSSQIQAQITTMTNLQATIAADDTTSSLKSDIKSITQSYRIFMLVIPQGAIEAAADRVLTVDTTMTDLGTKLQARIAAATSTANISDAQTAYADFTAKVADANTQATAANTEVASLQPDNGDATVMASNTAALKDARSKIKAAQDDLVAAHKDAITIVKDLNIKIDASATGSATTSQ